MHVAVDDRAGQTPERADRGVEKLRERVADESRWACSGAAAASHPTGSRWRRPRRAGRSRLPCTDRSGSTKQTASSSWSACRTSRAAASNSLPSRSRSTMATRTKASSSATSATARRCSVAGPVADRGTMRAFGCEAPTSSLHGREQRAHRGHVGKQPPVLACIVGLVRQDTGGRERSHVVGERLAVLDPLVERRCRCSARR